MVVLSLEVGFFSLYFVWGSQKGPRPKLKASATQVWVTTHSLKTSVNILHNAWTLRGSVKKATLIRCQLVPTTRRYSIQAMPERWPTLCSGVNLISTSELAPAFAALLQAPKLLNYWENTFLIGHLFDVVINVSTHVMCESAKLSSVVEYVFGFRLGVFLWFFFVCFFSQLD